jgi:hypothetical protein
MNLIETHGDLFNLLLGLGQRLALRDIQAKFYPTTGELLISGNGTNVAIETDDFGRWVVSGYVEGRFDEAGRPEIHNLDFRSNDLAAAISLAEHGIVEALNKR